MEHFKVTFDPDDIRDVLLNAEKIGRTETVLLAATNYYQVTLSPPQDYTPPIHRVLISGTTSASPLVIKFSKAKQQAGVADV